MERSDAVEIANLLFPWSPNAVLEKTLRTWFNVKIPAPLTRAEFLTLLREMERAGFVTIEADAFEENLISLTEKGKKLRGGPA